MNVHWFALRGFSDRLDCHDFQNDVMLVPCYLVDSLASAVVRVVCSSHFQNFALLVLGGVRCYCCGLEHGVQSSLTESVALWRLDLE